MSNVERKLYYKNKIYTLAELSQITGLSKDVIRKRCKSWGENDIVFETPIVKNKNAYKSTRKKTEKPSHFINLTALWHPSLTI